MLKQFLIQILGKAFRFFKYSQVNNLICSIDSTMCVNGQAISRHLSQVRAYFHLFINRHEVVRQLMMIKRPVGVRIVFSSVVFQMQLIMFSSAVCDSSKNVKYQKYKHALQMIVFDMSQYKQIAAFVMKHCHFFRKKYLTFYF